MKNSTAKRNIKMDKQVALKKLRTIPGVGKSISQDLRDIGIKEIDDLKDKSPQLLYEKLNTLSGVKQDKCVLYTFRCAVYFASENRHEKKKLNWWYWKDKEYID